MQAFACIGSSPDTSAVSMQADTGDAGGIDAGRCRRYLEEPMHALVQGADAGNS